MRKVVLVVLALLLVSLLYIPGTSGESNKVLVNMQIGNKTAYVNGLPVSLDVPPQIINGRTMVPIRFVSENLGAEVNWDSNTKTVTITMDSITYLNNQISNLENKVSTLEFEKTGLTINNGVLQEKVTQLEKDKADLNSQISVLQQKIEELQKGSAGNTATQIAAQNNQFIVYIENKDYTNTAKSSGSGFIATTDGKVVTNYHVIKDASTVTVKLNDGRVFTLNSVVNYDEVRDIAVLQLPLYNIQAVTLGDSGKIANGDDIVVIGNPLGLENSVTTGVISATSRVISNQIWIQFSAPVSPGSSGGPIFNSKGEVVGIVTSKIVEEGVEGINFAVPVNDVKGLLSYNKPATFSELFGSYGSNSWQLSDVQIQNAINWGKANKDDLGKLDEPFSFGPQTGRKTNGVVITPYQSIAYDARKNVNEGKDFTIQDAYDTLSIYGSSLGFLVIVYGDNIDFAKNYSTKLIVGSKTLYPTDTFNTDIADTTSIYPSSPKYVAGNTYYFSNSDISRNAIVTLVINNGYGNEETFVIDLSKYP
jgi:S1-C subfamily serine protease